MRRDKMDTIAAVQINGGKFIRIASQGFPVVEVDITELNYLEAEQGTSKAWLKVF
jgi:hypothetical protein